MKVRLLLFAILRDLAGTSERELAVAEGTTARHVWEEMRSGDPRLAAYVQPPLIAINEEYANADQMLREGDELAFIPPVAGG